MKKKLPVLHHKIRKIVHHENSMLLLPFLSLFLCSLMFLNRNLFWISFAGLIPFIYFCTKASIFSRKQIVRSVYWAGTIYLLVVFIFVLQTNPNSWTEIGGVMAILIKIAILLVSVFITSIGFWLIGNFISHFKSKPQIILLCLPMVWALSEFIRVYAFSLLYYGPGGSLSPNSNVGIIGMGAIDTPLVFSSRFVGLYGLSIIVILINIAVYLIVFRRSYKVALLILTPIFVLSILGYSLYRPSQKTINTGAVHLSEKDSLLSWDKIALPPKDLDILILPEYSLFFDNKDYKDFANKNLGANTTIITSVSGTERPPTNSLTAYSPSRGIYSSQPKTYLIATGEYVPYFVTGFFKLINQDIVVKSFNDSQQVKRGDKPEQTINTPNARVGALVCSGVLALNEYRRLSSEGAEVLVNSASLSLLAQASIYHEQEGYLTKFHAVSNAKPFLQSSRSGESYILSSDGSKLTSATGDSKLITSKVQPSSSRTLYSILGEWTLVVSFGFLVFMTLRSNINRRTKQ